MRSAKWLASICRKILALVVVVCVLMAIFVFSCYLVRQYETLKTSEGFKRNKNLFENLISSSADIGDFSNSERHYTITEKMIEVVNPFDSTGFTGKKKADQTGRRNFFGSGGWN